MGCLTIYQQLFHHSEYCKMLCLFFYVDANFSRLMSESYLDLSI